MEHGWIEDGVKNGLTALVAAAFVWASGVFWSNWRKASREEVATKASREELAQVRADVLVLQQTLTAQQSKLNGFEMAQIRMESTITNKFESISETLEKIERQLERIQSPH